MRQLILDKVLPLPLRRLIDQLLPWPSRPIVRTVPGLDATLLARLGLDAAVAAQLLAGERPRGFGYRRFTRPKADGSPRALVEPGPQLKAAQRAILRELLAALAPHPAALGYRQGASNADHAWAHAGAELVISADIADFFPSTPAWRVADWWRMAGYDDAAVALLTLLTTDRGQLPQGAPTSPALSNLLNFPLDTAIAAYTQQSGSVYTRYADDLAWSWRNGARPPADFIERITALLRAAGYRLNDTKGWQVARRRERPQLTGLILTPQGGVALPPALQLRMRTLTQSQHPDDRLRLAGYQGYAAMVQRPHLPAGHQCQVGAQVAPDRDYRR